MLEMFRREWGGEPADMRSAVEAVRAAVRAGILNDLGSGSHVDICCIDRLSGLRHWRERLIAERPAREAVPAASLGEELLRLSPPPPPDPADPDCSLSELFDRIGSCPRVDRLL